MILLAWSSTAAAQEQTANGRTIQVFVSTHGNDAASGTQQDPLATVQEAFARVRGLRRQLQDYDAASHGSALGSVEILLELGNHELQHSVALTAEDSGTFEAPVIVRGLGQVTLSGGTPLTEWQELPEQESRLPMAARPHVRVCDLNRVGLDPGEWKPCRLHEPLSHAPMELFLDSERLKPASWPNEGWAIAEKTGHGLWRDTRPQHGRKADRVLSREEGWAFGFWNDESTASLEPIEFDPFQQTIRWTDPKTSSKSEVRQGSRFRLCHLLSELDAPGEWYVDRKTQLLYYWPASETEPPVATRLNTLLSLYDVQHLTLENLTLQHARSMVVEIAGGQNVTLRRCRLHGAGNVLAHLFHGHQHRLEQCDLGHSGSHAIRVEGGDVVTLQSCEHEIDGCDIHDFCARFPGGRAGVALYGVGIIVRDCTIHSGPDAAIRIHGNDHRIVGNEIEDVCLETDDVGAIYLGQDPTYRGNQILRNFIHDIGVAKRLSVIGIYLDDFASGSFVSQNYLCRMPRGIVIGGGHDNDVTENVIEQCLAAIQMDARGRTWAKHHLSGDASTLHRAKRFVQHEAPTHLERYPSWTELLQKDLTMPQGNRIADNRFDGPIGVDLQNVESSLVQLERNRRQDLRELALTQQRHWGDKRWIRRTQSLEELHDFSYRYNLLISPTRWVAKVDEESR
ncbi:MAG: right-handed parallel beta-helix repeat-containing protein [Pirellulales bacterium]